MYLWLFYELLQDGCSVKCIYHTIAIHVSSCFYEVIRCVTYEVHEDVGGIDRVDFTITINIANDDGIGSTLCLKSFLYGSGSLFNGSLVLLERLLFVIFKSLDGGYGISNNLL